MRVTKAGLESKIAKLRERVHTQTELIEEIRKSETKLKQGNASLRDMLSKVEFEKRQAKIYQDKIENMLRDLTTFLGGLGAKL